MKQEQAKRAALNRDDDDNDNDMMAGADEMPALRNQF
jgi:hypothetical protein